MKEWDSMGISEDWSKSRRPPKKLTVVLARCHSGGDQVLRGKLCDEGKEIYQKKCCRIWVCVFLMKAVGFFFRRQSSSVTLQNNSWYAFLLKTDDLAGNALENYVRRYP